MIDTSIILDIRFSVEGQGENMRAKKTGTTQPTQETLYTIGKLAKRASERCSLRCTPTMIYNYERLGLMAPPRKTDGGTRLYTDRDLERLVLIKRLQREFGGSLDETKTALASVEDPLVFERDKGKLKEFLLQQKQSRKITRKKFVESKEARKRAMVNAALDLFEKKGYHRTTIADITSRSGTSHGTFYLYFRDKNALIGEIVETVMEATWKAVEGAKPKGTSSMGKVLGMVESFFQIDKRYQRMSHIFAQGASRQARAYDKRVESVYRKVSSPFIKAIEEGIRHGEFRCKDAKRAAFEIISLVELFRYRTIFKERFVFEKFGPDLEGFQEGRQMELLETLIEKTLDPAPASSS
jgi:AcrR family transcriptional regulator